MDRVQLLEELAGEIVRRSGALSIALREVIVDEVMSNAHLLSDFPKRKEEFLAIDKEALWLFTLMLFLSSALDEGRVSEGEVAPLVRSCMGHYERTARYRGDDYSADTLEALEEHILLNLDVFRQNFSMLEGQDASDSSDERRFIYVMMYLRRVHTGFLAVAGEVGLTGCDELFRRFGLTFLEAFLVNGFGETLTT
jgi:hypothetical protein